MSIRWMNHVWMRSPYRGEHLLLHLALADFANDEGTCFPSVPTLAKKARCSEQWVRKGVRVMIADGALEIVEHGSGRGNRNVYRLIQKGESEIPVSQKPVSLSPETRKSDALIPSNKNHHESSSLDHLFDQFWSAYPRKVGKGIARKAFHRLMAKKDAPSIHDLLNALVRYTNSISDPKYIAHPTTWLNGERWLDELDMKTEASGKVEVRQSIRTAESLGASFALAGYTEQDLIGATNHLDEEERQAAIAFYRRRITKRLEN